MSLKEILRQQPTVVKMVEHYLEKHAPRTPSTEPVTLPRSVFDALCMAALVGLEALGEAGGDIGQQT